MSVIPVVQQVRRQVVLTDGSVKFEITNVITDKGDLPFPHLFVVTINDPTSAKEDVLARIATPVDVRQADPVAPVYVKVVSTDLIRIGPDTFARIANTSDITKLPRDRNSAIRQGFTSYLTTSIALLYDNVTTADAAAKQVIDLLSALVNTWRTFNTNFATNPSQNYNLPQTNSGAVATRTALYKDARTARVAAEADRDAAQASKEACDQADTANKAIYNFLVYDVSFLDTARAKVVLQVNDLYNLPGQVTIQPAITSPAGPFVVTLPASKTHDYVLNASDSTSYESLLIKKRADLAVYAEKVNAGAVQCAQLAAAVLTAQQAVDAAMAAERAALASVVAVCPTFDTSTV